MRGDGVVKRERERGGGDMEVEFFSNVVSEEDTVEVDPENDNFGVEGERCGICMDLVIDRGVLDCCQHWFCFECIDNWSSIINLCPLCQSQFQLITCIPVYDPIGCSNMDEDTDCRDDDWGAKGNNNILSLPLYYIDENAVTCLDRDGCKIRSGSVTYEENLALDTSVACDSCDLWYHAFCVGFDPEGTHVDSWLCPRCLVTQSEQKSDSQGRYNSGNHLNPINAHKYCLCNTSAGKVPLSVADSGRTAVGVSRMDGGHVDKEPIKYCLSAQEIVSHLGVEQSVLAPDSCSREPRKLEQHDLNTTSPELSAHSVKIDEPVASIAPK